MRTLHLVVGYDGSEMSKLALAHAHAVAAGSARAVIIVAQAQGLPVAERGDSLALTSEVASVDVLFAALESDLKVWTLPPHVTIQTEVRYGDAADVLCEIAVEKEADFIFVGTHGKSWLERVLLGSVAERTLRMAPCSVIVVRPRAADLEPKVEPPCAECLKVQKQDPSLWCATHTHTRQLPMSLHYKYPEHFGRGSMNLRLDE
jgi:nucleotide-binding universal stress UspA family protein